MDTKKILDNVDEGMAAGIKKAQDENFCPELTTEGKLEAEALIEDFKNKIKRAADEAVSGLYVNVMGYIESDSWSNFRNQIMAGFKNYNNKILAKYDFKEIRKEIYKEFKDDIIKDLNQDLIEENNSLKETIDFLRKCTR